MNGKCFLFEDFADKVEDVFVVSDVAGRSLPLTLAEAKPLPERLSLPGIRAPFSLIFRGEETGVLEQRLYRVVHDSLGELDLFLVPVGKDAQGVSYQALFN